MRRPSNLELAIGADSIRLIDAPILADHLEFWLYRLVHRKYGDLAKPSWPRQYSARIEHEGIGAFFPLGSNDRLRAARKAHSIYQSAVRDGWRATFARFPREITLSIFWRRRPLICTYTTLYTERLRPDETGKRIETKTGQNRVVLVEPAPEVRAALEQWLARSSCTCCIGSFTSGREALRSTTLKDADLCLFSQHLPDMSEQEFLRKLASVSRGLPAYPFGIFEQSDDIFISISGIHEGYFLRRRPPMEMLDPIQSAWREGVTARELLEKSITRYFQNLFLQDSNQKDVPDTSVITFRESEVLNCLRKGCSDKQIAEALSISPSTVHTHLKKIFEKLGVHTRTEAVLKHLQK